jgi:hypothetical protein
LILQQALTERRGEFRAQAAALRLATRGRIGGDSAELIREDRDRG